MSTEERTTVTIYTEEENVLAVLRAMSYSYADKELKVIPCGSPSKTWRIEFSERKYNINDILKHINKIGYFKLEADIHGRIKYIFMKNEGS